MLASTGTGVDAVGHAPTRKGSRLPAGRPERRWAGSRRGRRVSDGPRPAPSWKNIADVIPTKSRVRTAPRRIERATVLRSLAAPRTGGCAGIIGAGRVLTTRFATSPLASHPAPRSRPRRVRRRRTLAPGVIPWIELAGLKPAYVRSRVARSRSGSEPTMPLQPLNLPRLPPQLWLCNRLKTLAASPGAEGGAP